VLPGGFSPQARDAPAWALTLQPTKEWTRDDRKGSQAGYVAMPQTVDWAAPGCNCRVGRLKREPAKTPKQLQSKKKAG
jgi:hypothetical protein